MKKCVNCGSENLDEVTNCQSCNTETFVTSSPEAVGGHIISPEEQRFWERMTFRQLAILFIRFQSIGFLAYAFDAITYLPSYFTRLQSATSDLAAADLRRNIWRLVFTVACHIAAAMAVFRYADRIASWLVRDKIPKQPPVTSA